MARKRKRSKESANCFSLGATAGHMLALSGEAHAAVRDGHRISAHDALDIIEFEAKEFARLMGRRLHPDEREAAQRIQKTAKAIMKEIKPSASGLLEIEKRDPLRRRALEIVHDVRTLLKSGNSACGNFPVEELRAKPFYS
jgi:hypothetical protein